LNGSSNANYESTMTIDDLDGGLATLGIDR
jgi:hypothetical protein